MKKQIVLNFDLGQICNDVLAKCNLISKSIQDEAMADIKASILTPDDPETRCIVNRAVTEAFGKVKKACQRYLTIGRTTDDNRLERLVKSVTYAKESVNVTETDNEGHKLYAVTDLFYKDNGKYYSIYTDEQHTASVFIQVPVSLGDGERLYMASNADQVIIYEDEESHWHLENGNSVTLPVGVEPAPLTHEELLDSDEITSIEYETVTLILSIENFNLAVTDDLKSSIHKFVRDYVLGEFLQDQHKEKAAEYKAQAEGDDYSDIIKDLNARDNYTMRRASFM